jgi:sec-independent protein translocase protein TatA
MYGFSGEHLLVLLIILLIFGPKRLPDLGHSIGRTLKNFKDGMAGGNTGNTTKTEAPPTQIEAQKAEVTPAPNSSAETEKKVEEKV